MARPPRSNPGGYVYHVLNRANARATLFHKDKDYAAFLRVLAEAQHQNPLRLLAYCLLPNHWHLVLWPAEENQLSAFLHWLTLTHTVRWLTHYHCVGSGHVYQGRFKSFPVCADEHLLTVGRYVERNALRAGLTERAAEWPWGSLWQRVQEQQPQGVALSAWPLPLPADWLGWVNQSQTEAELFSVRECVKRGRPYGGLAWVRQTAEALNLSTTLRPRGRPRKPQPAEQQTESVG